MDKHELQLGNAVQNITNNHNPSQKDWVIKQLGETKAVVYRVGNTKEQAVFKYCNLAPIPLSIDMLDKMLFTRQGKRNMWVKDKVCVVLEDYPDSRGNSTGEKFYIGFKDLGNVIYHSQFECPSVHFLQNAFALCGKQLLIN